MPGIKGILISNYSWSELCKEINRLLNSEKENIIEANNKLEVLITNMGTLELDFGPLNDAANTGGYLNISLSNLN